MYLRTTQRRNKDGSVVRYYALAENVRHPGKGYVEARVVHSFGRADRLDRAALERLGHLAGDAVEPLAQRGRGADDDRLQRHHGPGPSLDRGVARDLEVADHLDRAGA